MGVNAKPTYKALKHFPFKLSERSGLEREIVPNPSLVSFEVSHMDLNVLLELSMPRREAS